MEARDIGNRTQPLTQHESTQGSSDVDNARPADTVKDRRLDARITQMEEHPNTQQPVAPSGGAGADARTSAPGGSGYSSEAQGGVENTQEYRELADQKTKIEQAISDLTMVDRYFGANQGDGKVWLSDLKAAAEGPPSAVQEAAARLLADPLLTSLIDTNGDGEYSIGEAKDALATVKSAMQELKKSALESSSGSPQSSSTAADAAPTGSAAASTDPGMQMAQSAGSLQHEIDEEMKKMAECTKNKDTAGAQLCQQKIATLQMCQQMAMSAMQQYMNTMSNIAKMWSDMAMAAIRNMH